MPLGYAVSVNADLCDRWEPCCTHGCSGGVPTTYHHPLGHSHMHHCPAVPAPADPRVAPGAHEVLLC